MVLLCRKPPFKILGSSDSVVAQKSLIFIFVRVIISPEKNSRKPVSILRVEIGDFKLLVTDSYILCHNFATFGYLLQSNISPFLKKFWTFSCEFSQIAGNQAPIPTGFASRGEWVMGYCSCMGYEALFPG